MIASKIRRGTNTMKTAMVIHESLRFLGGGELVCLSTCFALQTLGYRVKLVTDVFRQDEVESVFGMGEVLTKCEQVSFPEFGRDLLRLRPVIGLYYAERSKRFLKKLDYDIAFVTRDLSRPRILPEGQLFRFVYETSQLRHFWENYRFGLKFMWRALYGRHRSSLSLLALSPRIVQELARFGYPSAELVYPSYGRGFRPQTKKNQVVYVTFLAPQKNVGHFLEIARRLPRIKFYLVGRDTRQMNQLYDGYAERILAERPKNVEYVETRIRQAPEFLEQSKIYLHTSTEQGMGIAVMEALSAGCLPVAPSRGGAGEVLEVAGVGFRYESIEDAVQFIESSMTGRPSPTGGNIQDISPQRIAESARIFSLEAFQDRISKIAKEEKSSAE